MNNTISQNFTQETIRKPVTGKTPEGFKTPTDTAELHDMPLVEVMDRDSVKEFMREIPKVDLHRHLEGSIEPETLVSIAERNDVELPAYNQEGLKPYLQITEEDKTLLDFISKFETIGKAFTDKEAIEEITYKAIEDADADNVDYLEMRFSPVYMASQYNLDEKDVMDGVLEGLDKADEDFDTKTNLTIIVERQMGTEHASHVAEMAKQYMDDGVVALDLANDEFNYPPGPYAEVFQDAKEAGLNITVHAGEAGGADNVRVSIEDLKADRIGHGVRTQEDPEVLEMVKEKGIPLEMCPTSNVQTGATDSMQNHPFRDYYDEGVVVTINSDDPGISDITLSDDYFNMVDNFGFSYNDVKQFVSNGIDSAFLPDDEKVEMKSDFMEKMDTIAEEYLMADDK
jgi:adenosine deaminase